MSVIVRRTLSLLVLLGGLALLGLSIAEPPPPQAGTVVTLRIEGAIGPATSDFIARGFAIAAERNAGLIVLEMDTPGGLDTSMRVIIKHILASSIPVATYVSPEGARAASAGTFILYASHIAAMAPATNLGAASPVAIGGPPGPAGAPRPGRGSEAETPAYPATSEDTQDETGEAEKPAARPTAPPSAGAVMEKATSDAAAYIRSLAQLRGRDADFAERAVREAASMSASEALEAGVIDLIAISLTDLMAQLDGREIRLDSGNTVTLATSGADIERISPDWRNQFLSVISNPQIALILMMIGIYGLFFEFTSPGFGVPGVAGLICILIAMYAFQLLPVNWAGVALIALGAILMIAEAFLPSFGVLGIGGVVAFVVGGLFLMDSGIPGFGIPIAFLVALALVSALTLLAIGGFAMRARKRRVVSGREELIGVEGVVSSVGEGGAYAHLHGESWHVASDTELQPGQHVRVIAMDGLVLTVEPMATTQHTVTGSAT